MTFSVTSFVIGRGKRHNIAFQLGPDETALRLLPLPSRSGGNYQIVSGIVAGVSGSFFIAAADAVISVASISVASPTVVTTSTPHGQTGTFNCVLKGLAGSPVPATIHGEHVATVTGASTFTVPIAITTASTATTGEAIIEHTSIVSLLEEPVGIPLFGVAGPTGQEITPCFLPTDKCLVISGDSESTFLSGYLLVEESYPRT